MSDRGFSIQELCALRGITLNRPKKKDNDQFSETNVASNFDIAASRMLKDLLEECVTGEY